MQFSLFNFINFLLYTVWYAKSIARPTQLLTSRQKHHKAMATSIRIGFNQSDSPNTFWTVNRCKKAWSKSWDLCVFLPSLLTSESVQLLSLRDSAWYASHPDEREPWSLCSVQAFREPKVQFRLQTWLGLGSPWPRPAQSPAGSVAAVSPDRISVRWGCLDLLSACCLCDGF